MTASVITALLASCSSGQPGGTGGSQSSGGAAASTQAEGPRTQRAPSSEVTCSSDFRIDTIDNGASPRFPMALNIKEGQVDGSRLNMNMFSTSSAMGSQTTTDLTGEIQASVKKIAGDAVTLSGGWKSINVSGTGGDEVARQIIGKEADFEVTKHVQPLAKPGELKGDLATTSFDQIIRFASRYLTPFPEENVGQGSKWQTWVADDLGMGSKICTLTTYTLDKFDGKDYSISGISSIVIPEGTTSSDQSFGTDITVHSDATTAGDGKQTLSASGSLNNFYPDSQDVDALLSLTTHTAISTPSGSANTTTDDTTTQSVTGKYSRP